MSEKEEREIQQVLPGGQIAKKKEREEKNKIFNSRKWDSSPISDHKLLLTFSLH